MKETIDYLKYKEIANNKEINAYLQKGNANLGQLGFTDHSKAHCVQVVHQAGKILKRLGYSEHEIELAKIAGYMHDIDRITVIAAIGNHDESTGSPEDVVSAALIIADKTDVRRSRVRQKEQSAYDIHDRVNYAVTDAKLKIAEDRSVIVLDGLLHGVHVRTGGGHGNGDELKAEGFRQLEVAVIAGGGAQPLDDGLLAPGAGAVEAAMDKGAVDYAVHQL